MASPFVASPALLDRLEAAHYRIIGALYGCVTEPTEHGLRVRSPYVTDPDWNHVGRIGSHEGASHEGTRVEALMGAAVALGREGDRRPTLTVSPLTEPPGLADALERRGWEVSYRFAWLVHPGTPPVPEPEGVVIREAGPDDVDTWLDLFEAVFMPGDPAAAGYRAALAASFDAPSVAHYLATCDGEPAGTASAVTVDGVTGGFNLGVLPDARRRGIGGALTLRRLADARRAGSDRVYLLTEDPAVEASQIRRGHVKAMTTEGWSSPETG